MSNKLTDKILGDVCLDERISDGIFNIENNSHMEVLREYLVKKGINENAVLEFSNVILDGKYPERQAYNQKGILVTFPTPEYKQKAIEKGTHFEKDPTKGPSNLFGGEQAPKQDGETPPPSTPPAPDAAAGDDAQATKPTEQEPKTNLPVSQAASTSPASQDNPTPDTAQVQTTAAPQQTPVSTTQTEPVKEPTALPPPPVKSPEEKEADKNAIKTMLRGDDYMLEQVIEFVRHNAHDYLIKEIRSKLYEG